MGFKHVAILQPGKLNHVAYIVSRSARRRNCQIILDIATGAPWCVVVLSTDISPENIGDLERFGVGEFGKHFSEALMDVLIALFDETWQRAGPPEG